MFGEWIMGIIGISALGILVDIVVKQGETEKYVKGVFGLFTLLVIVSPIPKLLDQTFRVSSVFDFSSKISTDSDYVEYVFERKYDSLEDLLTKKIKDEFNVDATFDMYFVESCPEKIDLVYVNIKKEGIWNETENKHITVEVEKMLSDMLGISQKKVKVEWVKINS